MAKTFYKSIAQLAQELGLTRDAVYKKIKRGEIDASKIGCSFASDADPSKYVSIAQFAEMVGVSRIAIYKRIKSGSLQAIRVGRNHLIEVEQVKEVKESRLSTQKSSKQKQKIIQEMLRTEKHFSVCELARELNLTRDAVYKKIKRGEIKATKVGRNFTTASKEREHISIAQLASILGISRIAVYKRVKNGSIVAQKVGRNHLIAVKYLMKNLNESDVTKLKQLVKSGSFVFKDKKK
jgi:excisionase family DNA binding protein